MIEVKINFSLHENQQRIHMNPARFKVIKAGKRFGKSRLAIFEACKKALLRPGSLIWYIGPTYGQTKDIAWRLLKDMLPKEVIRRKGQGYAIWESELTIELINGSTIVLKGQDNQDSLRGPEANGYICDEYAYWDDYVWHGILEGQLAEDGFAYFISSPNKNGRNHFTEFCEETQRRQAAGEDCAYFYFTIWDNPTKSREWIQRLQDNMPEDTWNLEYMALDSAKSGLIVSEFKYDLHVKPTPTDLKNVLTYRGLDWGMEHPTVCLSTNIAEGKPPVYVTKIFKRSDLIIEESSKIINQMASGDKVAVTIADPSLKKRNSQTKVTDLREFQRNGVFAIAGDNNDRGYDIMKMFFKKNLIQVDPSCKDLIYELRHVQYGDKEGDDAMDCLRYVLVYIHDTIFPEVFEQAEVEGEFEKLQKESGGRVMSLYDKRLFPNRMSRDEQDLQSMFDEAI